MLWRKEFKDHVPRLKFHDILNKEEVQFDWLYSLYKYGIALITDTPVHEGQVKKLGELVGYLKITAYGKANISILKFHFFRDIKALSRDDDEIITSLHFNNGKQLAFLNHSHPVYDMKLPVLQLCGLTLKTNRHFLFQSPKCSHKFNFRV